MVREIFSIGSLGGNTGILHAVYQRTLYRPSKTPLNKHIHSPQHGLVCVSEDSICPSSLFRMILFIWMTLFCLGLIPVFQLQSESDCL